MARINSIYLRLLLIASFFLLGPALIGHAQAGPATDHAGGPRNRIEVVLHADRAPSPGGSATLTLSATPLVDAPDLVVNWGVPAGVTLSGSARESFGPVAAGQTVQSQRQAHFPAAGVFKIWAEGSFELTPDARFGASGVLFFTVDARGSSAADRDPAAHSPMRSTMAAEVTSAPLPAHPELTSDDPCFTISGSVRRWDQAPAPGGYDARVRVPVRNAWVEIRESDPLFDDHIAHLDTDENGEFSHSFCDNDGWFDNELEIYVRLHSVLFVDDQPVVAVIDSSWIDETYRYDTPTWTSEGGSHEFNIVLNMTQSAVFNIADAILDAWNVWRDTGGAWEDSDVWEPRPFERTVEVHWEPGYGDDGSYYNPFWKEITIADDPSDPDEWDDSVIIHEFGHMADDLYSCDDNPGGPHFIGSLVDDPELAWGEGYPNYLQSMVRNMTGKPNASRYLDINGSGSGGINVDLEATQPPNLVSVLYEFAIAGALWDLYDTAPDGQDTLGYGPNGIQRVYTGDTFQSVAYGFFDDDCDFDTFARAWVQDGLPANAVTAAIIAQNTGYTLPPAGSAPITASADSVDLLQSVSTTPKGPTDGAWWNQVTYVLDNSQSMTGAKFSAAKTVLLEAINDLGQLPEGTEFRLETFNHSSTTNNPVFAGQFFPERLTSTVNNLSPETATDSNCQVSALRALAQAIEGQEQGHVWLFTDGDTYQTPSVGNVTHMLNERGIQASMALMGDCAGSLNALSPEEQKQLQGAARQALGPVAEDVPGGVVPYLLTAVNSGGQFLFVDESQVDNAAEILRAQITHSAGAGAWSDYVSDFPTYRWDELASWEYEWIDATGGTDHGAPSSGGYVNVLFPLISIDPFIVDSFTYYDESYGSVRAYQDGYLVFNGNTYGASVSNNVSIPNGSLPSNALYPFWDDLEWLIVCADDGPECSHRDSGIYSTQHGDWFVIEYHDFYPSSGTFGFLFFETLLNLKTGEIRFQYNSVPTDSAGGATIGIEDRVPNRGVQISYNDVSGASSGMGYKLLPAPAQPSKTYEVAVDAAMDGVGFLLTGYSGSFEPLEIRTPSGALVDCNDTANVLCLDLGLVQYVQADVDGRVGDWQATVEAGPTGEGTFSFTSIAASALSVEGRSDHGLTTASNSGLLIDLGQPVDGDTLSGQFVTPTDETFGGSFTLYDDGNHGDGVAGDGLFGADPFTPPGAGSAYLRITGQKDAQQFSRIDPVPYRFQPLRLASMGNGYNDGGTTQMYFELENLDEHDHCYLIDSAAPDGWTVLGFGTQFCADAGETIILTAYVTMGSANNTLPSGTAGQITVTATEMEEGLISATGSTTLTRARPPEEIDIHNPTDYLRPGGDATQLSFMVTDEQGMPVANGTEVALRATLGDISPSVAKTSGGYFTATFTSGSATGDAVVTADYGAGLVMADTVIPIREPFASHIELSVGAQALPAGGSTTLEALVSDRWGDPVANAPVRIGVEGDGQFGSVDGQAVVMGHTDGSGRFAATFESGALPGQAGVRAELLVPDGNDYRAVHDDRKEIAVGARLYLPTIRSAP